MTAQAMDGSWHKAGMTLVGGDRWFRHPGLVPGSIGRHTVMPMIERCPCVYILASGFNGTLYVGVTSDLPARIAQHREGRFDGFTKRYGVTRLVYMAPAETMLEAIAHEKRVKRYRRDWKRNLIERDNSLWDDLAPSLGLPPLG